MTKFIDTHAHLYLKHFKKDLPEVIERARNKLHYVVLPNIDAGTINDLQHLTEQYNDFCLSALGLHPTSVKDNYLSELEKIEKYLQDFPNLVGIGEIGLDFYWDKTFIKEQKEALKTQIKWAKELNLPVILHARDSLDELIDIIAEEQDGNLKGVFHCFTGNLEQAEKIISLDFFLGIGGIITFKKSHLPEIVREIGLDNVVLETDSPYLTPVPYRGKRNESAYTYFVAKKIAEILNISLEETAKKTNANATKLFNLQAEMKVR